MTGISEFPLYARFIASVPPADTPHGAIPEYENTNGHKYDLYIPSGLDESQNQYLILFIHGGSFNSGAKEDGDAWCKYYATKGYITATVDYTLQAHGQEASIYLMNSEIESAVKAIKEQGLSTRISNDHSDGSK